MTQQLFNAIGTILTVFSLFFTIVSAYLAALYLFLARAPMPLRLAAFGLLSIGLVFLGGVTMTVQNMQNGLFAAWDKLPAPTMPLAQLRNPVAVAAVLDSRLSMQEVGVAIGWGVAGLVYLALAYLTFVYRWQDLAVPVGARQTDIQGCAAAAAEHRS
ncbi:MAG: hypothetical protein SFW09_14465 [Hyphomicrobiaceae bacterium]|nr:hypothetical protein [Hyphomicrobiaceae bacterium]